jgi:cobaltochelatase CobS
MSAKLESLVAESIRKHMAERLVKDPAAAVADVLADTTIPVVEEETRSITLAPGHVLFSTLFGKAPMDGDFGVAVLKNEDIHEKMLAHVPVADPSYVVQIEECADIVRAFQINDRTLITGPTGSGKSSLVKHICAKTNRPMIRINMTGDVESSSIFGQLTVEGGATVWKDGLATEAVRYGAVLVNDEWDVTPPEIMFGYQNLMEDGGYLMLKEMPGTADDKRIFPADIFRFVCCGNTNGQGDASGFYAGTNVQNNATLNRFGTTVHLEYLSPDHEQAILKKSYPSIKNAVSKKMVQYANLIRKAVAERQINLTMSPRDLLSWAKKMDAFGYGASKALDVTYIRKLRDDEQGAARELVTKVFGK